MNNPMDLSYISISVPCQGQREQMMSKTEIQCPIYE